MNDEYCTQFDDGAVMCSNLPEPEALLVEEDDGFFETLLSFLSDHSLLLLLGFVVLVMLAASVRIIRHKEAAVIERLGRYNRTSQAGLRVLIPFIERIAERVDLQILRVEVEADIKTSGNEFMTLPVTVLYRAIPDRAHDAFYEVEEPEEAIASLVQNEVKSTASGMTLQEIFDSRDRIKDAVEETLTEKLAGYGYEAKEVVIDNPEVPEELEAAFNNVTVAEQSQKAATAEAEALRIKMEGEARAEAASLKIKGEAINAFRSTIAEGNAVAVIKMTEGTNVSHSAAFDYLATIDRHDAIRDAAAKGAIVVVATGTPTDGLYATLNQS